MSSRAHVTSVATPERVIATPVTNVRGQEPERADAARKSSYGQILKSSALIGGASAVNILLGIVRNKIMAVLLGPSGYGLMGLYTSILDVSQALAGLGLSAGSVRHIAESVSAGDRDRLARTVLALRRASLVLGLAGAALLALCAVPVSMLTFGDRSHAWPIAIVSIALLLRIVTAGQGALLQGTRRIADLARSSLVGGVLGSLVSLLAIVWLGEAGIVPALIGVAAAAVVSSWWYTRRIELHRPALSAGEVAREAAPLLKLGAAFMVSGILSMGTAYFARIIVLHAQGTQAAGLYQAAWTLAGLYIGYIMQAMGVDFYPRLAGVAGDKTLSNRLVNEQTQAGLLLAGPGVLATVLGAPLIMLVLFSAQFVAGDGLLRWFCVGLMLRTVSWPLGFVVMVHAPRRAYVTLEIILAAAHVGLAWLLVRPFGTQGLGIAFVGASSIYIALAYALVRRLTGFRWSSENHRLAGTIALALAVILIARALLPAAYALGVGGIAFALVSLHCARRLARLLPAERWPRPLRWLLLRLRLLKP